MAPGTMFWQLLCVSSCAISHAEAQSSARHGNLRVTALTQRLFRIENLGDSAEGAIPRQTIFGLNAKKLSAGDDEVVTHVQAERTLEMSTKYLSLRYDKEKGIDNGLTIRFKEKLNAAKLLGIRSYVLGRPDIKYSNLYTNLKTLISDILGGSK